MRDFGFALDENVEVGSVHWHRPHIHIYGCLLLESADRKQFLTERREATQELYANIMKVLGVSSRELDAQSVDVIGHFTICTDTETKLKKAKAEREMYDGSSPYVDTMRQTESRRFTIGRQERPVRPADLLVIYD